VKYRLPSNRATRQGAERFKSVWLANAATTAGLYETRVGTTHSGQTACNTDKLVVAQAAVPHPLILRTQQDAKTQSGHQTPSKYSAQPFRFQCSKVNYLMTKLPLKFGTLQANCQAILTPECKFRYRREREGLHCNTSQRTQNTSTVRSRRPGGVVVLAVSTTSLIHRLADYQRK
jgi:hypothetical protein